MSWKLTISETAEKQLSKLDPAVRRSVKKYLGEVCALVDPASRGHPLTGPFAGLHRYRIHQLRIIVAIERDIVTVTVATIARRDSVYD